MTRWALALFARAYRAYFATLRVRVLSPGGAVQTLTAYPFAAQIFALCECDSVALAGVMAGRRFTVLVAHGRDGDWVARALESLGCTIIRGSSRRGGVEAIVALIGDRLAARGPAAIVVDGPLGPPGIAKAGSALLAGRTGLPVCAVAAAARRSVTLSATWAHIYIPMPFTRLVVAVEFVPIGAAVRHGNVQAWADELTRALARARRRALDALQQTSEPMDRRVQASE